MATAASALRFDLFARDQTGPGIRSADSSFGKLGKGLVSKFAAAGAAIGAVSLFKGFISEARESAKIGRLTEAVIKSTGGTAGVTAKQVSALSTAMSNKTGVDDEAIQAGQNLLLTFTGVRNELGKNNDIFNQASQAAADMTAALNKGDVSAEKIKGSSIMLGKALNDPIKGITALTRSGVSFTEAQKKQIKSLVDTGDTMGAQKIILGELKKEFGGAAAAASDPAQKASVAWGNLQEQIGGAFLPALNKVMTFLSARAIPAVSRLFENIKSGDGVFARIRAAVASFGGYISGTVIPLLQRFGDWFTTVGWPAVQRFAVVFAQKLQPALAAIGKAFREQLAPALAQAIEKFKEAWPTISRVLTVLGQVAGFILSRVVPVLIQLYSKYLATTIKVFANVFSAAWRIIGVLIDLGKGVGRAGAAFGEFVGKVGDAIGRAWSAVKDGVGKIISTIKGLPGKALAAVGDLAMRLWSAGWDLVAGFIKGIEAKAKALPGIIKDKLAITPQAILKNIWEARSPSKWSGRLGGDIVDGLFLAIKSKSAKVVEAAQAMTDKLKEKLSAVKDFAKGIRDAFASTGNLTGIDTMIPGADGDTEGGFGALLAGLQAKAKDAQAFAAGLTKLRKMGLNATSLTQLREAGPDSGLKATQQLLSGGAGGIGAINALTAQIAAQGAALAAREAKATYGISPNASLRSLNNQEVTVILELRGDDAEQLKKLRKQIRVLGGNVQTVLGGR